MCMETSTTTTIPPTRLKFHSGSLSSMQLQQPPWPATRKNDRLGATSFLRHGKGLAMAMLTVAYIGNKCQELKDYYYEVLFAPSVTGWSNVVTCAALLLFVGGTMTLRYRWEALSRWTKKQVVTTITSVSSIEAMSRIRSSMSVNSMRLFTSLGSVRENGQMRRRSLVIAAAEPFLSVELVQKVSLYDMKNVLVYSVEVNKANFNKEQYLLTCRKPAREAISSIDKAVIASRGVSAHASQRLSLNDSSETDSLYFAAAMRLFADWRSVHLIPDGGYQRYAFGMNLAQRDLISNVGKIETGVHQWIMHHERKINQQEGCHTISVPTLRQLLQFEVDTNIHKKLPRLSDKSAASGLLWTMRQIQYQTSIFANIIRVPLEFPSGKAAVMAAYISTYDRYHGFLIKQVFKGSFDAAPEAETILLYMHSSSLCEPDYSTAGESETDQDDDSWLQLPIEDDDDLMDLPCTSVQHPPLSPLDNTLRQITKEWEKFHRFVSQCGGSNDEFDSERNVMASLSEAQRGNSMKNVSALKSATAEVVAFVGTVQPILDSCMQMIEGFNMNDPSKV